MVKGNEKVREETQKRTEGSVASGQGDRLGLDSDSISDTPELCDLEKVI
jgi:hypothetical protein